MSRPGWTETFLATAEVMQRRSRCERGAGAVVTDSRNQLQASGYTGPPSGWREDLLAGVEDCRAYCPRASKQPRDRMPGYVDCMSLHAEINCLLKADMTRIAGGAFYVSSIPCIACAKAVANSGVAAVAWRRQPALEAGRDVHGIERYFSECGLNWVAIS